MSALIVEISGTARKVFHFQNVFRHRHTVSKKSEREKKILFGSLLETLPQRRERLKLKNGRKTDEAPIEIETIKKKKNYSYKNQERDFLLNYAKNNTVQIIQTKPNYSDVNKISSSNSNDKNAKELPTPIKLQNEEINGKVKIEKEVKNTKTKLNNSQATFPSQIMIQNMLSFSIFDSTKSGRIAHKKMSVTNEVISLSAKTDNSNIHLPSVTRILSATMSEAAKKALAIWKEGMIKKLGVDGFNIYQQDLFKDGHDLHSSIENTLLQREYEIPEKVKPAFESVQNVLKDVSSVSALETHVVHPKLYYRGITDCVATYRGELCLIDWKKSDKRKDTIDSIYDAPTQVASYIGALNADLNYPFEIRKGVVVVAYTSGEEATVYEFDKENLLLYWKSWLKRLQKYFVDLKKA